MRLLERHERILIGALVGVALVSGVWFYTPTATIAARYVWGQWHAGELALALDQSDAGLALVIGEYYFGNQAAIGKVGQRPYELPLAEKAFGKAIEIDSSVKLARYMRARIEFIQSNFDAALADLDAELALYPENKRTLYMRGLTYAYRGFPGDLVLAEQDFRDFVAWTPREWAGYNDLAFVLAKEKKYADAAEVLKEGITKADGGEENPWLWTALGVIQLNLDKPAEAVDSFIKAQTFSESLTLTDWQRAYPGNNPSPRFIESGVVAMKVGIAKNLIAAYAVLKK